MANQECSMRKECEVCEKTYGRRKQKNGLQSEKSFNDSRTCSDPCKHVLLGRETAAKAAKKKAEAERLKLACDRATASFLFQAPMI